MRALSIGFSGSTSSSLNQCLLAIAALAAMFPVASVAAQVTRTVVTAAPVIEERPVGPYDVHVLAGGPGLTRPVPPTSHVLQATGSYTLSLWVDLSADTPSTTWLAELGGGADQDARLLGLQGGRLTLRYSSGNAITAADAITGKGWHFFAATWDGETAILYVDGRDVARGRLASEGVSPIMTIAPIVSLPDVATEHFGGNLADVLLLPEAVAPALLQGAAKHPPQPDRLRYFEASLSWPLQTRGQAGNIESQDPSLMPVSRAPFARPIAKPLPPAGPSLVSLDAGGWALRSRWRLMAAPEIQAKGAALSTAGFADQAWMAATVPGTVLTTMVDRGVYPDPDFGLNNLAIPESLNKQDYWYRIEFPTPPSASGHHAALTFQGINYAAEVWLNGRRLGSMKGAFLRGQFDVSALLLPGAANALAVRISPPPHPGIPQEQSIKAGPGDNGGAMCLDGPTFVATEGWDWIPAIRDRNSGIWQDVVLSVTDELRLGDPHVTTHLPLPDRTQAFVSIQVPVRNLSNSPVHAEIQAAFEGATVKKAVELAPGESLVSFTPAEFAELHVSNPRLWWPNGYGRPDLYHLTLTASAGAAISDGRKLTFGIREVTYELTLFGGDGRLHRVEVSPTVASEHNEQVVDVRHEAMHQTAEYWAPSLTSAGEHSLAVTPVSNEPDFTDLVIKVNGVRIAARGGNWGMDDSRKRVSREHLEPFFRLHRDANVNIIRNWVGQNTEEVFYQLADEYGLMVWNDFWSSTQDYNIEPQDVPLFLANARDVVRRFRNHPSIVLWCGRNEGVPQPILNEGLIDIFREEDGTRYYSPGSNRIDLRDSGPYAYRDPVLYYTTLDQGFSVELGISSLSTLESLRASMAPADQWPVSDAWAYHDWHQSGNGDVHPLAAHMEEQFGAATSLPDFERKAQMFNYVDHRAIFEGFNQHLWAPNSGRLLWMTQPAWPSNSWQILSSDYDTQASYYGVKKACEPLHVQLDLSNYTVTAVNTTLAPATGLHVNASVYSITGKPLLTQNQELPQLLANGTHNLPPLVLAPLLQQEGLILVELTMKDSGGTIISRNVYWLADKESHYRRLNELTAAHLEMHTAVSAANGERVITVRFANTGSVPALTAKLTLLHSKSNERILPAYYSDNYVSLMPGEQTQITIRYPASAADEAGARIGLRGWNVPETVITVR